jgi:hypothetical protein
VNTPNIISSSARLGVLSLCLAAAAACGVDSETSVPEPSDSGTQAADIAVDSAAADVPDTAAEMDVSESDSTPPVDMGPDASTVDIADDVPDVEEAPEISEQPDVPDVEDTPDVPDAGPPYWPLLPEGYSQSHFEEVPLDGEGKSVDLEAFAPENTVSFVVMLSGGPKDVWMRMSKLLTPLGHPLIKSQGSVTCITCLNRTQADQILATTLVPNAPDVPFYSKGKYTLEVWQFSVTPINGQFVTTEYTVTPITARILWKQWPEEPTAGTLDLNLYFTGAGEITAAVAEEHPRIVKMLAELQTALAAAGIDIGEVRYLDAPAEAPSAIETTVGVDSDLAALLGSTPDAAAGINLFFVSTIVKTELIDGSTGVVLGIAGGVPGPPWLEMGSPHSGVAVSLDDTEGVLDGEDGPQEKLGSVAAHELGHYLGLYHTVEQDGDFDHIDDTAEDSEAANLMYWAWTGAVDLTPGQGFVMLRHPSVWLKPGD